MVFVIHWHESAMDLHVFPILITPPTSVSTWSLWVFPVHQARALVSCIQPGLVICFTHDNIHVSMLFSRNIPPSPSPTESKSLFCTSVSLFLFCIEGYRYHLSKFHIYVLVYCVSVSFLVLFWGPFLNSLVCELGGRLKRRYSWLITSDWSPKAPGAGGRGGTGEKAEAALRELSYRMTKSASSIWRPQPLFFRIPPFPTTAHFFKGSWNGVA